MEPIIEIDGTYINLRNVDFIDIPTKQIRFNHGKGGDWARLNCDDVHKFEQKVKEQLEKINTKEFN